MVLSVSDKTKRMRLAPLGLSAWKMSPAEIREGNFAIIHDPRPNFLPRVEAQDRGRDKPRRLAQASK
jgi:hypothetical protein